MKDRERRNENNKVARGDEMVKHEMVGDTEMERVSWWKGQRYGGKWS